MATYTYGSSISRKQAVTFIASVAYPDEKPRSSEKRVREAIRYAILIGKLSAQDPYVAGDLFGWAATKWPALRSVAGLPITVTLRPQSMDFSQGNTTPAIVPTPPDPMSAYLRAEVERQRLEREIVELRQQVSECRRKAQELSRTHSVSGAKARGKPKRPR